LAALDAGSLTPLQVAQKHGRSSASPEARAACIALLESPPAPTRTIGVAASATGAAATEAAPVAAAAVETVAAPPDMHPGLMEPFVQVLLPALVAAHRFNAREDGRRQVLKVFQTWLAAAPAHLLKETACLDLVSEFLTELVEGRGGAGQSLSALQCLEIVLTSAGDEYAPRLLRTGAVAELGWLADKKQEGLTRTASVKARPEDVTALANKVLELFTGLGADSLADSTVLQDP